MRKSKGRDWCFKVSINLTFKDAFHAFKVVDATYLTIFEKIISEFLECIQETGVQNALLFESDPLSIHEKVRKEWTVILSDFDGSQFFNENSLMVWKEEMNKSLKDRKTFYSL